MKQWLPVSICLILICIALPARGQMPPHLWSSLYGGNGDDNSWAMATDSDGNVLISSEFNGTIDFGGGTFTSAGGTDIYLARFDINGNHLWSKTFGDGSDQFGRAVEIAPNGDILICGGFRGSVDFGGGPLNSSGNMDIFMARFDSDGSHLWSRRFGDGSYDECVDMAIDNSGNIVIVGYYFGGINFGGGNTTSYHQSDGFVARFDPSGNYIMDAHYREMNDNRLFRVDTDASGNIFVGGHHWVSSLQVTDITIRKYDPAGNQLYWKTFANNGRDNPIRLVVDSSGNAVMAGYYSNSIDFGGGPLTPSGGSYNTFIVKFDNNCNHLWSSGFGNNTGHQIAYALSVDSNDNISIGGRFESSIDLGGGALISSGDNDAYLALFDPNGNHQWSERFGGTGFDMIAQTAFYDDAIFVNGKSSSGSIDLGGGPLANVANMDVFLALYGLQEVATFLESFSTSHRDGAARIDWSISEYQTAPAFSVLRSENGGSYHLIDTEIEIISGSSYRLTDGSCLPGRSYSYRVNVTDNQGSRMLFETESISIPAAELTLHQNIPNPFNPSTSIGYYLPEVSHVKVEVFDSSGRRVATLADRTESEGYHELTWNGLDSSGRQVSSGVYFYSVTAGKSTITRKMIMLR